MATKVDKKVVFLSKEHANTTFIVQRKLNEVGRSLEGIPLVEHAKDDKKAVFRQGLCQTDDPVVIAFLEEKEGVWRGDDPLAGLKMQHGNAEVENIAEAVRQGLYPTPEPEEGE